MIILIVPQHSISPEPQALKRGTKFYHSEHCCELLRQHCVDALTKQIKSFTALRMYKTKYNAIRRYMMPRILVEIHRRFRRSASSKYRARTSLRNVSKFPPSTLCRLLKELLKKRKLVHEVGCNSAFVHCKMACVRIRTCFILFSSCHVHCRTKF